jgi:hypothetical protein
MAKMIASVPGLMRIAASSLGRIAPAASVSFVVAT